MAKKNLKRALGVGLGVAAALAAKKAGLFGGKTSPVDTSDLGSEAANVARNIAGETENVRGAIQTDIADRAAEEAASKAAMAAKKLYPQTWRAPQELGVDEYGFQAGAKKGRMMKAAKGASVVAKGNKLARSKPTKIC